MKMGKTRNKKRTMKGKYNQNQKYCIVGNFCGVLVLSFFVHKEATVLQMFNFHQISSVCH